MFAAGQEAGIETRGISDHGFIHSIYFRDPNGYVVELCAPVAGSEAVASRQRKGRAVLTEWTAARSE